MTHISSHSSQWFNMIFSIFVSWHCFRNLSKSLRPLFSFCIFDIKFKIYVILSSFFFFLKKTVTKFFLEIIVKAKVKTVKWVAKSERSFISTPFLLFSVFALCTFLHFSITLLFLCTELQHWTEHIFVIVQFLLAEKKEERGRPRFRLSASCGLVAWLVGWPPN